MQTTQLYIIIGQHAIFLGCYTAVWVGAARVLPSSSLLKRGGYGSAPGIVPYEQTGSRRDGDP